MIATGFALFRALPGLVQLIALGALLASLAGAYAGWHHKVYSEGWDAAIAEIAADNKEAVHAVNVKKSELRDCVARGGAWDQSVGLCR